MDHLSAKMYSAYNTARAGGRKPPPPKPSSSSASVPLAPTYSASQTTPQKQQRPSKSLTAASDQPQSDTTYVHANSPLKLRKLVLAHSPRKPTSSSKSHITTPKLNPFESTSGGGKGSPDLFADLLLHAKDTPRTKARRFLIGTGSPPKPQSTNQVLSRVNSATGPLATFLSARTNESQTAEDVEQEEVLGPSPFKPKPVPFRCLFEDPDQSASPDLSPIKNQSGHPWKMKSGIPFVPSSQPQITLPPVSVNLPEGGQADPPKAVNKTVVAKRKRMKPGEEDESFYENVNDPDDETGRPARTVTKKTRRNAEVSARSRGKGKSRGIRTPAQAAVADDSDGSDQELLNKMPALPFGAQHQTGVITELETFIFAPQDPHLAPAPVPSTSTAGNQKHKWKGKGKASEPPSPPRPERQHVKVGTQKVMVRPYKPVTNAQMERLRAQDAFADEVAEPEAADRSLGPIDDEEAAEEGEETRLEDDEADDVNDVNDDDDDEGDIVVSEELMNVLSIKPTTAGDRKAMERAKARDQRVRHVLEGAPAPTTQAKPNTSVSSKRVIAPASELLSSGEDGENGIEDEDDDWEEDPEGWKELDLDWDEI